MMDVIQYQGRSRFRWLSEPEHAAGALFGAAGLPYLVWALVPRTLGLLY
jgi:hypothetical protein